MVTRITVQCQFTLQFQVALAQMDRQMYHMQIQAPRTGTDISKKIFRGAYCICTGNSYRIYVGYSREKRTLSYSEIVYGIILLVVYI